MKKMLALLLTLCLLAGLLPATALARSVSNCPHGNDCTTHEAAIGSTHYDTIGEAIDAANQTSGSATITITLLQDATLTGGEQSGYYKIKRILKNITLDLGTHTLTYNENGGFVVDPNCHFTIQNGTYINASKDTYAQAIEGTKRAYEGPGCTITIAEDAVIKAAYGICADGHTTINVYGKIISTMDGIFGAGPKNKVTLDGATIEAGVYGVYQQSKDGGSTYTIKNSTITTPSEGATCAVFISNNKASAEDTEKQGMQTLVIENSVISGQDGIEVMYTNVTISGEDTEVTAAEDGHALGVTYYQGEGEAAVGTLKIEDGTFKGDIGFMEGEANTATLTISGGTFLTSEGSVNKDVDQYIQPGMTQDPDTGKIELDPDTAVAKIGDVGYSTLAAAITAAKDGDTITICKEYDATSEGTITLNADKAVTLDLGGNKLTLSRFNLKHGQLTVQNGSVSCEGQAFNVYSGATATEDLYTKLVIKDNVTINANYGICLFPEPDSNAGYNSAIEVYGKIESGGIFVSGNLGNDTTSAGNMVTSSKIPTITIYEGAVVNNGTEGQGIAMNGLANVTVNGGTVSGSEAIGVKRGTLIVNGGVFNSNGAYVDPIEANNNGTEATGAAISITGTYNYAGTISVTLKGGTFTSQNAPAVYLGHSMKNDTLVPYTNGVNLDIQGGTFTSPDNTPTVYVADKAEEDAESYTKKVVSGGTFSTDLSESGYLTDSVKYEVTHQAGGFSYTETLPAAQELAQSGDTITELNVAQGTTTYTLTLQYNDGATANVTYTVASGTQVPLPTPTRVNYHFDGWSDGTTTYNGNVTYTVTTTVTLTARWTYNGPSSSGGSSTPIYSSTVEKTENGTVTVSPKNASKNTTVTITVTPDEGYELASLTVTDKDGKAIAVTKVNDTTYTFTMPDGKVTVAATFGCDGGDNCPSKAFTDLGDKQWYHDSIDYAVEHGLLEGTSATTMEPNATLIRAQLAQILYNIEDKPAVTGEMIFEDVPASEWFYSPVLWANQNEIINGTSATTFEPLAAITRQDLALMLYRYAGKPAVTGDLDGFTDADQVGDWADEAMAWAVAEGIVQGDTPTTLNPTGTATRAEAAAMLQRFLEDAA